MTLGKPGTPIKRAHGCADKKRGDRNASFIGGKENIVRKNPLVGTITGAFNGALDGVLARLIGMRKFGYTVELLLDDQVFCS
jgi:hypothetical protein